MFGVQLKELMDILKLNYNFINVWNKNHIF